MLAATREKDGSNEDPGQPKINKSIDYVYVVNRLCVCVCVCVYIYIAKTFISFIFKKFYSIYLN